MAAAVLITVTWTVGPPASATYPGANGRITYGNCNSGAYPGRGLYVVNSDGSGVTRLTTECDLLPRWAPDGIRLVFSRDRANVWVMNFDGTGQTNLTPEPDNGLITEDLSWSPDGTRILYQIVRPDGTGSHLWTMGVDGTGKRDLTMRAGNDASAEYHATWSVTDRIAFIKNGDIWVMNADGSDANRVAVHPYDETLLMPDWSPDGSRILYTHVRSTGEEQIWVMNADGTNRTLAQPAAATKGLAHRDSVLSGGRPQPAR